jgi:putative transposase
MATTKRYFYSNEFYHIILRGIDGKTLFLNDQDYFRMINGMFVFNDKGLIGSSFRHKGCPNDRFERKRKGPLVNIHAFCLMPNHIHFLLEQKVEGGLSKFMLKIGAGYAAFFNNKYKRKGHLFQSRFKSVLIKDDDQLAVIFSYIHTNPVSIIEPN